MRAMGAVFVLHIGIIHACIMYQYTCTYHNLISARDTTSDYTERGTEGAGSNLTPA